MSKFVDRLMQVSQGGQPMGFRAAVEKAAKPRMLLVAAVVQAEIAAGADAGLLVVAKGSGAKALERASEAVPDIPWGCWLKEGGQEGVAADFVVFPAGSLFFGGEKVGKVLEVEPSLEPSLLKMADELPVDAVLVAAETEPLTWRDLMLIQRCATILNKPLLVSLSSEVTASELGALWEAGVRGVVVKAGAKGKTAEIAKMLETLAILDQSELASFLDVSLLPQEPISDRQVFDL